ncbi:anti-sigma factor [Paenibacillus sp. KQZ6P-2]|uniref:Anti-sigma factor n=1 Tax=Paenibacillus mangrovi TaxID=2931978 RepID=A0A9X2B4U9_9BACL|nr:anti-sigma factor [Paenibacillus mangrovi]MCJ8014385.1 anti-sigma factor [Paenibacillus mangrovi]
MSDDFKQKLQDYRDGKLTDEEHADLERELEKMEVYQSYLDETLGRDDNNEDFKHSRRGKPSIQEEQMHRREKKLLRRGKWKVRFGTVLTLMSLFIWFTVLSAIGTGIYYTAGDPDLGDIDRDVIESAIAVGYPNTSVHLSSNAGPYFNMKVNSSITKRVGDEYVQVGDFSASFLFSWMRLYHFSWSDSVATQSGLFQFPGTEGSSSDQEWNKLEKLPEGTVAEAYVSYNRLYTTDEILQRFKGKSMDPVWFAVDNGDGSDRSGRDNNVVMSPIGFPANPVWHPDDGKISNRSEQKTGIFSLMGTSTTSYPDLDMYGSGELRDENFIKTLRILTEHKYIAKQLIPFVDMKQTLEYVEKHGVHIYGAVVTGPTKEILKLKNDPEVSGIHVGKVTLWNWHE